MAATPEHDVWLGAPLKEGDADAADVYVSKIGGKVSLLRAPASEEKACPAAFRCPKCKTAEHVSLLAQLYAPLECYDRVVYVLSCAACGVAPSSRPDGPAPGAAPPNLSAAGGKKAPPKTSYCFAVRSQNFSAEYYRQLKAEHEQRVAAARAAREAAAKKASGGGGLLFAETDDWGADGDDADDWGGSPGDGEAGWGTEEPAGDADAAGEEDVEEAVPELRESFPLAPRTAVVQLRGRAYTSGLPLDLFLEPSRPKERLGSVEAQLAEAQQRYGVDAGTLDTTSMEQDDETPAEKVTRKYMERIELAPTQCVRWCPGGEPLRASLAPALSSVPPCPLCRAPRRFECQLTAPVVYFLTKGIGESRNSDLHFGNVFVFTCSKNCYADQAYVPEFVVTEDEL